MIEMVVFCPRRPKPKPQGKEISSTFAGGQIWHQIDTMVLKNGLLSNLSDWLKKSSSSFHYEIRPKTHFLEKYIFNFKSFTVFVVCEQIFFTFLRKFT